MAVSTAVAALDLVAAWNTVVQLHEYDSLCEDETGNEGLPSMIGYIVRLLTAASTSPMVKRTAMMKQKENKPLIAGARTIASGTRNFGLLISALMWITPSKPCNGNAAESRPIHHCIPGLFHPLNPVNVVAETNSAGFLGAITKHDDNHEEENNIRGSSREFKHDQEPPGEYASKEWKG